MQRRFETTFMCMLSIFFAFLLVAGCAERMPVKRPPEPFYWPTKSWQTSTPEMQGMDSTALQKALDLITTQKMAVHSLLIVRHGYVVLDTYFYPYSRKTPHDVASVTKSITTTLIGIAYAKGYLKDLDQPVTDFFPEYANIANLSKKKRVTIRNLMRMASGFDCGYAPDEPELLAMRNSADWLEYALNLPMAAEPGSEFAYCSCGMHLLSAIISRSTGQSALDFAHQHLFGPLGITQVGWPTDWQGNNHGWGDLQMFPQDMAKIGYLYLHQGRWDQQKILTTGWFREATNKQIAVTGQEDGYGYGWWIPSENYGHMAEARGRGGQRIIVWPAKDIIVVITGGGIDLNELGQALLPTIVSDRALPTNPQAFEKLRSKTEAITQAPASKPLQVLPQTAKQISGKQIHLTTNKLGLHAISLEFHTRLEAHVNLFMANEHYRMPLGLDGIYRFSTTGPSNLPTALKGQWANTNQFILDYNEVARINHFTFDMTFNRGKVNVQLYDPTGYFNETILGRLTP